MPEGAKLYAPDALRVLVVDDLGFMRIALRQIVETDGDMRVVGEARNGEEAPRRFAHSRIFVRSSESIWPRSVFVKADSLETKSAAPNWRAFIVAAAPAWV